MSNHTSDKVRADDFRRHAVASAPSYGDAAEAVNQLAENGFPVERAAIVARGLRLVEHVVGQRGAVQAAAEGALAGAMIGGIIGLVFGLFTIAEASLGVGLVAWGLLSGAVIGTLLAVAARAVSRRRRFDSFTTFESDGADVVVDETTADRAERLLREWALAGRGRRLHRLDPEAGGDDRVRSLR